MRKSPTLHLAAVAATLALACSNAVAAPPAAASNVVAYAPNEGSVHLFWTDNSSDETGWLVDRFNFDNSLWEPATVDPLPPDFEIFRGIAPSTIEQTVRYRVAPTKPGENRENLNWTEAEVTKPSGSLDLLYDRSRDEPGSQADPKPPLEIPEGWAATAGQAFSHQIEAYDGTPDRFVSSTLPAGVALDETTGIVSGVVAAPGVHRFLIGVEFDGGKRFEQVRFLRVLPAPRAPIVARPGFTIPKQHFDVEGFLDIGTLFADPERPKGVWIQAGGDSFIVALHDRTTPKTVENFLGYVRRKDYDATFFHRSVARFIIQSGGFGPLSDTAPPTSWRRVASRPAVQNEPAISNTRGTIAMAKIGGDRDSATNQWFFNIDTDLAPNADNLDFQNGGFTVFGEIVGSAGGSLMDAIGNLSTTTRSIFINGEAPSIPFPGVPIVGGNQDSFVRVASISEVRPLHITLDSNSAQNVVSAEVVGPLLFLRGLGPAGTANLTLRATNLDGESVTFQLPVRIGDIVRPALRLTSIRASRPLGTLLVRGRAADDTALGKWRYKVNGKRWTNAGSLKGKNAAFSRKMKGFKLGRNVLRIEVRDRSGNSSGILVQRFTLS